MLLLSHHDHTQIKWFFLKQICLQKKFHGLLILQRQPVPSSVLDSIYQDMFPLCFECSLSGFRGREGQWSAQQFAASLHSDHGMPGLAPKCWEWDSHICADTAVQHGGRQGNGLGTGSHQVHCFQALSLHSSRTLNCALKGLWLALRYLRDFRNSAILC